MAIILDADVIIRGEKGDFDLAKWLALREADDCEIAAITVAELGTGSNAQPHRTGLDASVIYRPS